MFKAPLNILEELFLTAVWQVGVAAVIAANVRVILVCYKVFLEDFDLLFEGSMTPDK